MRYTDRLRQEIEPVAYGRWITFRYRIYGKLKKVRGRFIGIVHRPRKGFYILLTQVRWRGNYWGGLRLKFRCRDIVWVQHYDFMFPLLEAGTSEKALLND